MGHQALRRGQVDSEEHHSSGGVQVHRQGETLLRDILFPPHPPKRRERQVIHDQRRQTDYVVLAATSLHLEALDVETSLFSARLAFGDGDTQAQFLQWPELVNENFLDRYFS